MNVHLDANAVVQWEKGTFDLAGWIEEHFSRVPGLRLVAV